MLRTRVIPTLLLRNGSLVKTKRFGHFTYVGDPCNTVRIFNELEVDELLLLDIVATQAGLGPDLATLADIASECFMPLAYGGGVRSLDDARAVFGTGAEKVAVNSSAEVDPGLVGRIAATFGSQAVIGSIDYRRDAFGRPVVYARCGRKRTRLTPATWARTLAEAGAGEILLTCIDREGTWSGFDLDTLRQVSATVDVPVIANGGAGTLMDIRRAVRDGGASAVALGSMVVFQKRDMGVLVNFPDRSELRTAIDGA